MAGGARRPLESDGVFAKRRWGVRQMPKSVSSEHGIRLLTLSLRREMSAGAVPVALALVIIVASLYCDIKTQSGKFLLLRTGPPISPQQQFVAVFVRRSVQVLGDAFANAAPAFGRSGGWVLTPPLDSSTLCLDVCGWLIPLVL